MLLIFQGTDGEGSSSSARHTEATGGLMCVSSYSVVKLDPLRISPGYRDISVCSVLILSATRLKKKTKHWFQWSETCSTSNLITCQADNRRACAFNCTFDSWAQLPSLYYSLKVVFLSLLLLEYHFWVLFTTLHNNPSPWKTAERVFVHYGALITNTWTWVFC